jgi:hypothetical protein
VNVEIGEGRGRRGSEEVAFEEVGSGKMLVYMLKIPKDCSR